MDKKYLCYSVNSLKNGAMLMTKETETFKLPSLEELLAKCDRDIEEFERLKIKKEVSDAREGAVNAMREAGFSEKQIALSLGIVEKDAALSATDNPKKEKDDDDYMPSHSYERNVKIEDGEWFMYEPTEMTGIEDLYSNKPVFESVKYYWESIRGTYDYVINGEGLYTVSAEEKEDCRKEIEQTYAKLNPELAEKRAEELKRREIVRKGDKESEEYKQAIGKDKESRIKAIRKHYEDPERKTKDAKRGEEINKKADANDAYFNPLGHFMRTTKSAGK